jgi:hypothetical protein
MKEDENDMAGKLEGSKKFGEQGSSTIKFYNSVRKRPTGIWIKILQEYQSFTDTNVFLYCCMLYYV